MRGPSRLLCLAAVMACQPTAMSRSTTADTASTLSAADRTELFAVRDSVWHRWFAGDTAHLKRVLPVNFLAIPNDTNPWQNRDAAVNESLGFVAGGGKLVRLDFPQNEIQTFGPVSVIFSKYDMELDFGGQRQRVAGRVTEVFVKRDGRWIHPSWHLDSGQ